MCYSFESSFNNWLLILLLSACLIVNDKGDAIAKKINIWIALFALTFGQIQIIEAMIWNELKNSVVNKQSLSKLVSYIPILLIAQPLVQCLGAYYVTKDENMLYLSFLYVVILLYQLYTSYNINNFNAIKGENGHLVWIRYDEYGNEISIFGNSIFGVLYLIGLFLPLLWMPDVIMKYSLLTYGIMSLIFSVYYSGKQFYSFWCYIGSLYACISLIISYIK